MKGGKIQIFFVSSLIIIIMMEKFQCYVTHLRGWDMIEAQSLYSKGQCSFFLKEKRENFHFSFCFIHPKFCTLEYFGFFFVCSSLG